VARIRKQAADVRLAWEGESTSSAGVVEAFITAENERRKVKMNGRQLKAVFDHGVPDETSGEYGTLSFVENAITRGAQELDSMRAQRLMEGHCLRCSSAGAQAAGRRPHPRPPAACRSLTPRRRGARPTGAPPHPPWSNTMNFLLLIRDPERDIKGQHADGWVIKYTYDDEHPDHHTRLINAKRGEHIDRRAIILYGKRIRTPIEHDKIAQSMGPGEWVIDENDPSTWDNSTERNIGWRAFSSQSLV
jgi:hypothetical protein